LFKYFELVFLQLQGAFNKFQDYVLNTTTVNHTFLTVMLLFNIFSLCACVAFCVLCVCFYVYVLCCCCHGKI